ncbi:permease [Amylibacter ulvae]|uniref:Permease n=1 Tax=Paramylibacter ulvae TaxID=1651968 RepID=A0ABQ3D2U6_9RHOB|nr:DMT family transporter [Amylibacter ulvae]GHA55829.1 permease [Amylibacter ulvae]
MSIYNGIALRLLGALLITAMSAVVHHLAKTVPIGQIIFWRSAVAIIPIIIYMFLRGQFPAALKTKYPKMHFIRGLFGVLSMAFSFISLAYLPVANAQALAYMAPIMTLPLAAIMVGERISKIVIFATAIGFGGVVAMLWDALSFGTDGAIIGIAAGLGFAVTMAFVRVHIKTMTATEHPATIALSFALVSTLVGISTIPLGWITPDYDMYLWLIAAGILGGLAHIAGTEAVARAPISTLAPFDYTGIIWALTFDLLIFSQYPNALVLGGAAAITLAALMVVVLGNRQPKI